MPMDYKTACKQYLFNLQSEIEADKSNPQRTPELSFRTPLDNFFKSLLQVFGLTKRVKSVLEPKKQAKAGRPDWLFYDKYSLGIYGYVEAKGYRDDKFDISEHQEQIERYRTLGHKLLITDGIDFYFSTPEGECRFVSLINKEELSKKSLEQCDPEDSFKVMMQLFFESAKPRRCSESELITLMAVRTRFLSDDIQNNNLESEDEARDEGELRAYELLERIRDILYRHNDSSLQTPGSFAHFVAQTIMFTLLYAYRTKCRGIDAPVLKEKVMKDYLREEVAASGPMEPFLLLTQGVWNHGAECNFISQWIEESILFLSFVKMSEKDFDAPDYHQLFEQFLLQYSRKMRFDFGAFYTPSELASYTVALTKAVAHVVLDGRDVFDAGNRIVDPCCGTGSFLERIIQCAGDVAGLTIGGIEILPAPYMLANYRMSLLRREKKLSDACCRIILANSLSDYLCDLNPQGALDSLEDREIGKARDFLAKPIHVIIGNPPCSDRNKLIDLPCHRVISRLMDDFRPPQENRRGRQNTQKQVTNSFMLFLRWSCERLKECDGHSILSFIVPSSFLEAESFRYARKYLCENFSAAWILEVDADARTGIRTESIFRTLQGRALIVLVRKSGESEPVKKIHYGSIAACTLADKKAFLAKCGEEILQSYKDIPIREDGMWTFRPTAPFDELAYAKFWRIGDEYGLNTIFCKHCSGVKLAPTALFVHLKQGILQRRTRELVENRVSPEQWFQGQAKPPKNEKIQKFASVLSSLAGEPEGLHAAIKLHIEPYAYRPFLFAHVLYWKEFFAAYKTEGEGTRQRPELKSAFEAKGTIGFAMAHAPKDLSPRLSQFASFCWCLPDNDMCTRGNSHIYLNQYPQSKEYQHVGLNIHPVLINHYVNLLGKTQEDVSRMIVFYVYAILCSQVYLDEFEGALFVVRQSHNPPAIPMVNDAALFTSLADAGERLARLEKPGETIVNFLHYDYESPVPSGFRLFSHDYCEEDEMLFLFNRAETPSISVHCPLELYSLVISGYHLVKDVWLKFHLDAYHKADFTQQDLQDLYNFLNRLYARNTIVSCIDEKMIPIIREHSVELLLPPTLGMV